MPAPSRYDVLYRAIDDAVGNSKYDKPFRILEVGTYNGAQAARMIRHAAARGRHNVAYYGFDLFELMTPEKNAAELSKSVLPPTAAAARKTIASAHPKLVRLFTGESYEEIESNRDTLPLMDVIYVDGGHSLMTIARDWLALRSLVGAKTRVVFDDYYRNRDDAGCKRLVDFLAADPAYKVVVDAHVDTYDHTGLSISQATLMLAKVPAEPQILPPEVTGGNAGWGSEPLTPEKIDALGPNADATLAALPHALAQLREMKVPADESVRRRTPVPEHTIPGTENHSFDFKFKIEPSSPEDLEKVASGLAAQIFRLDQNTQQAELDKLKAADPALHALVEKILPEPDGEYVAKPFEELSPNQQLDVRAAEAAAAANFPEAFEEPIEPPDPAPEAEETPAEPESSAPVFEPPPTDSKE